MATRGGRRRLAGTLLLASLGLLGFDTTRHSIPVEEILSGGPPKDGIPAILAPQFVDARSASFLHADDRVVGVVRNGEAKAYPLRVLNWHEVVNDEIGEDPVAVTYCPLTGSAVVYDRSVAGTVRTFGVSGRLYRNNVLLYDHETESLWSQLQEQAVTGDLTGTVLAPVPAVTTTWTTWLVRHPETLVLSTRTGHRRDYGRDPYSRYHATPGTMFRVADADERLPAKTKVYGLRIGQTSRAYPLERIPPDGVLEEEVGGRRVRVEYDTGPEEVRAFDATSGELLPGFPVYWFAWAAFHPDTSIWAPPAAPPPEPDSAEATPRGRAAGNEDVLILSHAGYWTDIFGIGFGTGTDARNSGPGLFLVRGDLRNTSTHSLDHVRLTYELLGSDGEVVASEYGFNRGSEVRRPIDSPVPVELRNEGAATPIPRGGRDSFRMVFLRNEIPPFRSYRVRVVDAVASSGASR